MATILIGGGSGMIGMHLSQMLREKGYEVLHLSRRKRAGAEFETLQWDVEKGYIDPAAVERADYVINLAGAGIGDKLWTDRRKKIIIDSRVDTALLLKNAFERLGKMPRAYLSSTGMHIYGNRGEEILEETSSPGEGFLTEVCQAWESAIDEVAQTGIRTVAFRFGIVLSMEGGALPRIMMPLNFFVAPYFGSGRQWYSWIHMDDACRCFIHALENERLQGKYNGAAPNPVRNKEFMRKVIDARGKPALLLPVPAFALRLGLGELADTVLYSTRVSSKKIEQTGFEFEFKEVGPALEDLLKRKA